MKKEVLLFIIQFFVTLTVLAQDYKSPKLPFVSQTMGGVLLGRDLGYTYYYNPGSSTKYAPVYQQSPQTVASLSIETFNGLEFFPKTAIGLSTGVDLYSNGILVPLALGVRHILIQKSQKGAKIQAGFDAGYSVTWLEAKAENQIKKGGLILSPKFCFIFPGRNGSAFLVNFAYKLQKSQSSQRIPGDQVTITETFNTTKRFGVSIGFQF
jgi:hypothetical protein